MNTSNRNWAGNYRYGTDNVYRPETVEQVVEVVRSHKKIRVLGTRHSFNGIADSTEAQLSTEGLTRVIELDRTVRTVTVEAGIKYGALGEYLQKEGFALRNLASLPHISVGGACATATHGSGELNGNLATAVVAMELVKADGQIVMVSRQRNDSEFDAMVVGLGGFGVVIRLTLEIVPSFAVRQYVFRNLPMAQLEKNFDAIQASGYSVSLFTDWRGDFINQVWLKRTVDDLPPGKLFGATAATRDLHPIEEISAENCTPQMGVAGAWHERLPHFRMGYTPSSGEELQAEYFVPRRFAIEAFRAVAALREEIAPLLLISELRTVAADSLWMSPCYQQDCVGIHFTWKPNQPAVEAVLEKIERSLEAFVARPHWGKLFQMSAKILQGRYSKFSAFRELMRSYDPGGKFRNAFLDQYIFD